MDKLTELMVLMERIFVERKPIVIPKKPTIEAEPVVHCKECKYFKWGDYCTHEKMEHSKCRENDFCSYGENRGPEDEDEEE